MKEADRMELDKTAIREIVIQTISELKRSGFLREYSDLAYTEACSILKAYYDSSESDAGVKAAISGVQSDPYFKILPLYFSYSYTIEGIAEYFNVDISTIVRNKKRLCLKIYDQII